MGFDCQDCEFRTFELEKALGHVCITGHSKFDFDAFDIGHSFEITILRQS